eukprot:TRINITY_DN1316_c1_g1_i1.p1 TRINITY_DN1316_c1_g1~~TRINITY_DN1316_c1_g1_i1.p1  ORF type:complete len:319 (+),score=87.77 TRINITY_DN1316_c1_g1_i1:336-1292(+)
MAVATAHHDCEEVSAVFEETSMGGTCSNDYTLTRIWNVVDCSGGMAHHSQVITVIDNQAPVMSSYPVDIGVQCDAIRSTWPGKLSAHDNCDGDVPVKFQQRREASSCRNDFLLIRKWIAEDSCGNINLYLQTVLVSDSTPPDLNGIPQDSFVEYEQINNLSEASLYGITAIDNCPSQVSVVVTEKKVSGTCPTQYLLVRTWTAVDHCGNGVEKDQTINVVDNIPPKISKPDDETVECDAIPVICDVKVAVPVDDPDYSLSVSNSERTVTGSNVHNYRLIRSWWVEDCAKNKAMYIQTLVIQDTTPPVFTRIYDDETHQ